MVAVVERSHIDDVCDDIGADDDTLRASIVAKHAELCALHRSLLEDIAEHDARQAWQHFGTKSEIDYLIADLGLVWRTAKTWVHAAHAIARRPEVGERYRQGDMSFDQLTSIVEMMAMRHPRIVTPIGPFDDDLGGGPSGDGANSPEGTDGFGGSPDGPTNPSDPADPSNPADPDGAHGGDGDDPVDESPDGGLADPSGDNSDLSGDDVDGLLDLADRLTPGQLCAISEPCVL